MRTVLLLMTFFQITSMAFSQGNTPFGFILGGFTDFIAGGIVTAGAEYYFSSRSKIVPTLAIGYDFTSEAWNDGTSGRYQAIEASMGLRISSDIKGSGFFLEPTFAYQRLWLTVYYNDGEKTDAGGTLALNFLYGYRHRFGETIFLEGCGTGGYSFSPVNLATDPFPYNYRPSHIDWHCWNNPAAFSLLNTFLVRLGILL